MSPTDRLRFLVLSGLVVLSPKGLANWSGQDVGEYDSDLALFGSEFVPNIENAPYHGKWVSANRMGDALKWATFRDALLTGQTPSVPSMATKYGKALVAAGKEHMSISHLVGMVVPAYPTPLPPGGLPPEPPGGWQGPTTISAGGTYSGAWASNDTTPAVTITTTAAVTIRDSWIRNTSTGDLIKGTNFQIRDLTLERTFCYGGTGRVFDAEGCQQITVRNCTIDRTSGIKIAATLAGSTILVTRNKQRNIQGPAGYLSAFFKVAEVQNATIEVSWNEIINEYNASHPEDIISLFKSANATVHNNYIQHNSTPGNAYNTSSQGTITVDYPDGVGPVPHDITINDNQMVDTVNAVLIPDSAYNVMVRDNRLIQDGKLPDGVTQMGNGYSGWAILAGVGANCHMHNNVTGFVNRDGIRYDWHDVLAAPEGRTAEIANNTTLPDPITAAMEADEWQTWLTKLSANGISVGA